MTDTFDDAETETRIIVRLLAAATDSETRPITSAAIRAGLMWICDMCGEPQYANRENCCLPTSPTDLSQ